MSYTPCRSNSGPPRPGPPERVFREIAYCTFYNKKIINIGTRARRAKKPTRAGRARVINLFCRYQKYSTAVDRFLEYAAVYTRALGGTGAGGPELERQPCILAVYTAAYDSTR